MAPPGGSGAGCFQSGHPLQKHIFSDYHLSSCNVSFPASAALAGFLYPLKGNDFLLICFYEITHLGFAALWQDSSICQENVYGQRRTIGCTDVWSINHPITPNDSLVDFVCVVGTDQHK